MLCFVLFKTLTISLIFFYGVWRLNATVFYFGLKHSQYVSICGYLHAINIWAHTTFCFSNLNAMALLNFVSLLLSKYNFYDTSSTNLCTLSYVAQILSCHTTMLQCSFIYYLCMKQQQEQCGQQHYQTEKELQENITKFFAYLM